MPAVAYPLELHIDAPNQYQFTSRCSHIATDKVNFFEIKKKGFCNKLKKEGVRGLVGDFSVF